MTTFNYKELEKILNLKVQVKEGKVYFSGEYDFVKALREHAPHSNNIELTAVESLIETVLFKLKYPIALDPAKPVTDAVKKGE